MESIFQTVLKGRRVTWLVRHRNPLHRPNMHSICRHDIPWEYDAWRIPIRRWLTPSFSYFFSSNLICFNYDKKSLFYYIEEPIRPYVLPVVRLRKFNGWSLERLQTIALDPWCRVLEFSSDKGTILRCLETCRFSHFLEVAYFAQFPATTPWFLHRAKVTLLVSWKEGDLLDNTACWDSHSFWFFSS